MQLSYWLFHLTYFFRLNLFIKVYCEHFIYLKIDLIKINFIIINYIKNTKILNLYYMNHSIYFKFIQIL